MTFGATVRILRQENKLSLREFSRLVGLSPSYVSLMERQIQPPPSEAAIIRISKVLGSNPDHMLGLAGKVASDVIAIITDDPVLITGILRELKAPPV